MPNMRAKLRVIDVTTYPQEPTKGLSPTQQVTFCAVYKQSYEADGLDEDNTFAKFTPQADLKMVINNPALVGQFNVGDKFYVDFTPIAPAV